MIINIPVDGLATDAAMPSGGIKLGETILLQSFYADIWFCITYGEWMMQCKMQQDLAKSPGKSNGFICHIYY